MIEIFENMNESNRMKMVPHCWIWYILLIRKEKFDLNNFIFDKFLMKNTNDKKAYFVKFEFLIVSSKFLKTWMNQIE